MDAMSYSTVMFMLDDLLPKAQLRFLMLTKSDRKEGQRDRQREDRFESDGGGDENKVGCWKGGRGA